MNTFLFILGISCGLIASNLLLQQHAFASSDIEIDTSGLYKLGVDAYEKLITEYEKEYPNTSTLSNREIAIIIMDNGNFSNWQEAYIKIVEENPKGSLESIWSFLTN